MFNNFMDNMSETVVEQMFLQLLKDFTVNDLSWATSNNVSLLALTEKNNPKLLRTASGLAKKFKGQGYLLNTKNVMIWLKEKRPELYTSLNLVPERKVWLSKQVNDFRQFLFEM